MKIVSAEEMRGIDARAAEFGLATAVLMENAGLAFAEEVRAVMADVVGRRVMVLCGPGNNGGDGLVAARHLDDWGADVSVFLGQERPGTDYNLKLLKQREVPYAAAQGDGWQDFMTVLHAAECVIDALFGTGQERPLAGVYADMLDAVRAEKRARPGLLLMALDLPSGLNADTGAVDPHTAPADVTVTLGLPKYGLFLFPGAEFAGDLMVADIGIPAQLTEHLRTELITPEWVRSVLPLRPRGANKGTFGRTVVVAGSPNYVGAGALACEAAMRVGAGLVTLALPHSLQPILASKLTETVYLPLPEQNGVLSPGGAAVLGEALAGCDVLLIGCGIGQHPLTAAFLDEALIGGRPLPPRVVVDADALNLLSRVDGWWKRLPPGSVLTPHPGEMSRLVGMSIADVQSQRLSLVKAKAQEWGHVVLLKGAYTVVADTDGRVLVSSSATAALATAGTGDVLAGAIAGLLAQGLEPFAAAAAAVYLHAAAGEDMARDLGDAGVLAGDLPPLLPRVIKRLREG